METVTIPKTEYESLIKYKYIVAIVEEELHERPFNEAFVQKTEELRKGMHTGKRVGFKSVKELDQYLEKRSK